MTTRLFKGSTAPIATSGVSTMATNLGGAVRMVARPYRIGNETGVPIGDIGVVGVRGLVMLRRPLELPEIDVANDGRRGGVGAADVERVRLDTVRVRNREVCRPAVDGVSGLFGSPFAAGLASPSVHCKCKMIDLVAHCQRE